MHFTMAKTEAKRASAILKRAVPKKTPLSILDHVLIEASDGVVTMSTTDLGFGLAVTLPARVVESGRVALPARQLFDAFGKLSGKDVSIEVTARAEVGDSAHPVEIESAKRFAIVGDALEFAQLDSTPAEDFPTITRPTEAPVITIEAAWLRALVACTAQIPATGEVRAQYSGVQFRASGNTLSATGSDGFRLAARSAPATVHTPSSFMLPGSALRAIALSLPKRGDVEIAPVHFGRGSICFRVPGIYALVHLIAAELPAWAHLQAPAVATVEVSRAEIESALKGLSGLARDERLVVQGVADHLVLTVTGDPVEDGEMSPSHTRELPATVEGEREPLMLNVGYVRDAVALCDGDRVLLSLPAGEGQPVVIQPSESELTTHLIMQLRLPRWQKTA